MALAPAPLFRDPIYDGAADPVAFWNPVTKSWWIVYTNRRASIPLPGLSWVHGTALGAAESRDHGASWLYRGTLEMEPLEPGHNTYWAPEIIWANGLFHMYVSYISGVPNEWEGHRRRIAYYQSEDGWRWRFVNMLRLSSENVIDACVYPLPDGRFRMWYKDETSRAQTFAADSDDLREFTPIGAHTTDCPQEGPNVFALGGRYWMIADTWDGQAVYSGDDLSRWTRQDGNILQGPGPRRDDGAMGNHADVVTLPNGSAYIFYFTHPERPAKGQPFDDIYATRRTSLQAAELIVRDGRLVVIREGFDWYLPEL